MAIGSNVNGGILSANDHFSRDFLQVLHHDAVSQLRRLFQEGLEKSLGRTANMEWVPSLIDGHHQLFPNSDPGGPEYRKELRIVSRFG